jgi:hypothetical protein
MKKLLLLLCSVLLLTSCGNTGSGDTSTEDTEGKKVISSADYVNFGRMGDVDGPAFAVYSRVGYSGASATLDLASMEINTVMDRKFINGYAFFGIDVYAGTSSMWLNCVDVGLCWSGREGGWHVFYNIYDVLNKGTPTWYESSIILPKDDIYDMSLTIVEENYALFTIKGRTNGATDEVRVEVKGAEADGYNTALLFNAALDYPPNTKIGTDGKRSEDFVDITLANTDKGLYMRNIIVDDLTLYQGETAVEWTNDKNSAVSIWPDKTKKRFDYAPTSVEIFDGTKYIIHFDMNR